MPYATLTAGRDYVVLWRVFAPGGTDEEWRAAAAHGTRALGLEPMTLRPERDGVRVEAHAFRDAAPWLPVASGHLQADEVAGAGGATTTGAASRPNAANVRRGGTYRVDLEAATSYAWRPGEWDELASQALRLLGLDVESAESSAHTMLATAQWDDGLTLPIEVAHVPDWGWTGGPPGSAGYALVQTMPARLRVTRVEEVAPGPGDAHTAQPRARTGAAMPPAAPALVCRKLEPRGGAYAIAQGVRYRALVSVSSHFTTEAVRKYLLEHGWSDVVLVDEGQAPPAAWPRDEDLAGLEDGHRWVRGEALRSGEGTTIDVVSTLHKLITVRLSVYRIADLWACEAAPAAAPRAPAPASSPAPSSAPPATLPRIGSGPGPGGLDEHLPLEVAPAIVHAWQTEADPGKLRALAATMRMGGFPIASQLLDQQALYAEAELRAAERPSRDASRGRGKAIGLGLAVVGTLAALVRR